jgi:hypothetical protein
MPPLRGVSARLGAARARGGLEKGRLGRGIDEDAGRLFETDGETAVGQPRQSFGIAGRTQDSFAARFDQATETRAMQPAQIRVERGRGIERPAAIRNRDQAASVGSDPQIRPAAKSFVGSAKPQAAAPAQGPDPIHAGIALVERYRHRSEFERRRCKNVRAKRIRRERSAQSGQSAAPRRCHLRAA